MMPEKASTTNDKPVVQDDGGASTLDDTEVIPAPQGASERVSAGDERETPETPAVEPSAVDQPETFTRVYVQRLRDEAAKHRIKAKRADDLARELFTSRVAALGRLADPTDLVYDEVLFDADAPALEAAVDELIARKPHLANRRPSGDVDQGAREQGQTVDLAGMLRARAG